MTQEKLWDYFQVEDDSESNVIGASNARYKYLVERVRTGDSVLNIGDLIIATLPGVKRVLKEGSGRFMGTVPADENLAESQCVCPHCGEIFHRWGHVQSFTRERLSKLLAAQFRSTSIGRRHFADPARLNWKGKVVWIAKSLLLALKIPGKNDNFFFLSQ